MDETVITRDGLVRLTAELERLTTEGRQAVAERLRNAAASEANRAENADYLDARQEQAMLERRIALLDERLRGAQVVEPDPGNGRIDVGERVQLRDVDSGEQLDVELVGPFEADVGAARISVASPLGGAIVGLRSGEIARVVTPRGTRRFEVLAVESPTAAV